VLWCHLALASKLRFIAGMLVHWVRPFADARAHLREGYEVAVKIGDTTYEVYSAVVLSIVAFCESTELGAVQAEAQWAREVSARRKDRAMVGVPDCHARHATTLRGLTPSVLDLGTVGSNDADFRATLSDEVTPTALFYYQFCGADLAYHFGEVGRARALLREAKKRTQGIFGLPTTVELSFLDALVAAREHDRAPGLFARLGLRRAVARELKAKRPRRTSERRERSRRIAVGVRSRRRRRCSGPDKRGFSSLPKISPRPLGGLPRARPRFAPN
jgi:hypothetical protein